MKCAAAEAISHRAICGCTFGLKQAAKADLEIHWPSGQVDKVPGVKANQAVRVVEGKGQLAQVNENRGH